MVTLGNEVRNARKEKHLSQEALAERLGVCKKTIINIEKNDGNPKFAMLFTLVRELDLPVQQVFYPEVTELSETKMRIIQELEKCTEKECKVVLSVLKGLLAGLKAEREKAPDKKFENF